MDCDTLYAILHDKQPFSPPGEVRRQGRVPADTGCGRQKLHQTVRWENTFEALW